MIEYTNIYMYIVIGICILLPILFDVIFHKKELKTKKLILFIMTLFNFTLHFVKLIDTETNNVFPINIYSLSPYCICAISVLISPFVIYSKNSSFKNYVFILSTLGGLLALLFSNGLYGGRENLFETIRYIICHVLLTIIGILAYKWKVVEAKVKYVFFVPLYWIIEMTIIFLNELLFHKLGLTTTSEALFWSAEFYNASLVFGPRESMMGFLQYFMFMVPDVFRTNYFNVECVGQFYMPVLWEIIPSFTLIPLIYLIFMLFTKIGKKKNY